MAHDRDHAKKSPATDRICKSCSRVLATTSPQGDLVPASTKDQACEACQQFEELYAALQTTDEAFLAVAGRRTEYGPRVNAVEACKAAHKAFDNFLITVEMQPGNDGRSFTEPETTTTDDTQQHGLKRSRTLSSTLQPAAKRLRSTLDNTRRVSFDTAVVFRDKENGGRPESDFNRRSDSYAPGRNAPPNGTDYLDTSGYGPSFVQFLGVKKHGKGWVETKEGKVMDEKWQSSVQNEEDYICETVEEQKQQAADQASGEGSKEKQMMSRETVNRKTGKGASPEETYTDGMLAKSANTRAPAKEQSPTEPSMVFQNASDNKTIDPSTKPNMSTTQAAQTTNIYDVSSQASPILSLEKDIRIINEQPPTSPTEDAKLYTYGMGWSAKFSPKSAPRGTQWRASQASLTKKEWLENEGRGREDS
ncbi:hypothetical protein P280DRAFT_505452 [Massarina eburnea CBS 473.64]|uniref:Uncharacterized protein n=1 Tax=Massarina eburnea CBS 473.64 TaxID=1395130 RepID=A0A6A6S6N4_9PLEO|nr:hypothetical protein P280DRAFT_505452 [Massarina eburnea CBS 473.64]